MIEMAFEYTLSVIDYTYLLFFYLKLINKKWVWKKAVPAILGIAVVQYVKDSYFDFGSMSLLVDWMMVTAFLYLYAFRFSLNDYLYAMIIYGIFDFAVIFFISCAIELGFDLNNALIFGVDRIVLSVFLKLSTIGLFVLISHPLQKLHLVMDGKAENIMVLIMSLILIVFAYVFSIAKDNSIFLYTSFLSLIMSLVFYLFYRYCLALKQKSDEKIIQHSIEITSDYVKNLEKEHNEVRKIRHDIRNKLSALEYLLNDENYNEAKDLLNELNESLDTKRVSISGNVYLDAILRQKINEYDYINFNYEIEITNDFKMEGNDLISIVSNVIDNACEELTRIQHNAFRLTIKGNSTQLMIKEENKCRYNNSLKTDKDHKIHGYGLKIIEEITIKYGGSITYQSLNDVFTISILIPL